MNADAKRLISVIRSFEDKLWFISLFKSVIFTIFAAKTSLTVNTESTMKVFFKPTRWCYIPITTIRTECAKKNQFCQDVSLMRYFVFLLIIFISISTQGQTHQVQSSKLKDLTGEILIIEGGNEVNCNDGFNKSFNNDQLWISYTGDEDVEFTIIVNKFISISGHGGGEKHYFETFENTYDILNDDDVSQYICWDSQNNRYIVDLYSFVFAVLYDGTELGSDYYFSFFDISGAFHFLVSVRASGYNDLSGKYTAFISHGLVDPNGPCPPYISDPDCFDLTAFITIEFPCSNNWSSVYSPYNYEQLDLWEEGVQSDVYAFERRDEDYYVTVYAENYSAPTGIEWGESSKTLLIPARAFRISISRLIDNEPQSGYYIYGEKESYAVVDFICDDYVDFNFGIYIYIDDHSVYFNDYEFPPVVDLLPYGDAFGGERHIEVIVDDGYSSFSVDTVLTYHPIETNLSYNSLIIDVNSGKGGFNLFIDGEEVELSTEGDDLPAHIYALPRLDHDYSVTVQVGNNLYEYYNGNLDVVYTGLSQETTILVPAKEIFDFEEDGVYYSITSENEVIVAHGEEPYQGVVNIPSTVTCDGVTYTVTGIGYDAFADADLTNLVLPVTISNIDSTAFTNCHIHSLIITGDGTWTAGAIPTNVDQLYVMSGVTGIAGLQENPATVYSYSTVPPTCDENTFISYDAELHVPASALAAYFTAPYWSNFINITSDAIEPTGLSINKDSIELLIGNQLSLTATPTPANATPANAIIWTSTNDSIATVVNGVITAARVGECDIKAVLLDKIATCHVTVTEIPPTSVTINPEFAKLESGTQLTLTATVLPEDATDKVVTWESTNSAVATVSSEGIVTAVAPGECFITATCRDNQATCHIIVVDHFIYVSLDEHNVRLLPNHMMTLSPSVIPEGTSLVVTSSNPTVAAARMANGIIQVVGITEGKTVISVNSTDGYAEADSCVVTVYTERGDVNCDGFINISDVTSLVNRLLTGQSASISEVNADTNNDGQLSIADVTRLINHLLSGNELDPKEEPGSDGLSITSSVPMVTLSPWERHPGKALSAPWIE